MSDTFFRNAYCFLAFLLVPLMTYNAGMAFAHHSPVMGLMHAAFAAVWWYLGRSTWARYT